MKRILAILTLVAAVAAFAVPPSALAQSAKEAPATGPKKVYTIFMVLWRGETRVEEGLRKHIKDHHLPFRLIVRNIDRDAAKLPEIRREIARTKPDLVYSWGTTITLALVGEYDNTEPSKYITKIPVVFVMVTYPTGSRIVASLELPRKNVTGVVPSVPLESQIKAMQAYRPVRRLAVIYNALESNSVINIQQLKKLSTRMDFELLERRVPLDKEGRPDASAIPRLVAELAIREPQFLYIGPDNFVGEHRDLIADEAMRYGLPAFTATELELFNGKALLGLVARYKSLGQLAGYMIERILIQNVAPAALPIQRLTRFTYGVRMSIARKVGIYPPMSVLDYAEIIDERRK